MRFKKQINGEDRTQLKEKLKITKKEIDDR